VTESTNGHNGHNGHGRKIGPKTAVELGIAILILGAFVKGSFSFGEMTNAQEQMNKVLEQSLEEQRQMRTTLQAIQLTQVQMSVKAEVTSDRLERVEKKLDVEGK
jgi:hypothetical protein